MFSKVWVIFVTLVALSLQVHAHAAVSPEIGVKGTPQRSDVKRPSTASPCGSGVNIASALASSTPVTAAADGTFTATAINFNGGADGSRKMTMQVDASASGTKFVAGTITQNGDANPTGTGTDQIVAALPAGTKCTGGASGNLCLASFKSTSGFGNCVLVQQGAATPAAGQAAGNGTASTGKNAGNAGNNAANNASAGNAGNDTNGGNTANNTTSTAGNNTGNSTGNGNNGEGAGTAATGNTKGNPCKHTKAATAGTRAPRALLAQLAIRERNRGD